LRLGIDHAALLGLGTVAAIALIGGEKLRPARRFRVHRLRLPKARLHLLRLRPQGRADRRRATETEEASVVAIVRADRIADIRDLDAQARGFSRIAADRILPEIGDLGPDRAAHRRLGMRRAGKGCREQARKHETHAPEKENAFAHRARSLRDRLLPYEFGPTKFVTA